MVKCESTTKMTSSSRHNRLDQRPNRSRGTKLLKSEGWWDWAPLLELDSAHQS